METKGSIKIEGVNSEHLITGVERVSRHRDEKGYYLVYTQDFTEMEERLQTGDNVYVMNELGTTTAIWRDARDLYEVEGMYLVVANNKNEALSFVNASFSGRKVGRVNGNVNRGIYAKLV